MKELKKPNTLNEEYKRIVVFCGEQDLNGYYTTCGCFTSYGYGANPCTNHGNNSSQNDLDILF